MVGLLTSEPTYFDDADCRELLYITASRRVAIIAEIYLLAVVWAMGTFNRIANGPEYIRAILIG